MPGPILPACKTPPPGGPGGVWFIATTGVDGGTCAIDAPCATLAHVASRMESGQTVYLRAGTYAQRIAPGTFPGGTSWAAPTTIAAYQNEVVTLQVSTGIVAAFTAPATDRYILLSRLILDGNAGLTTQGLVVGPGAGPLRFQNGQVRNTGLERVSIDGGLGVELLSSTISGGLTFPPSACRAPRMACSSGRSAWRGVPSHGVQMVGPNHTQARLTQNTFRTNAGTGLDLAATGVLIDNNLIVGNGLGMQVRETASDNQILNNTVADNTGVGVQIDEFALATVLTNMLIAGNASQLVDSGEDTVSTTNLLTAPGFVGGGDYHIASGASPAVDAGTTLTEFTIALDGTTRPQGAAWDIGAYERAGTPAPPGVAAQGAVRPQAAELFFTTR